MYDAVAESALVEELELGAHVGRQRRLAPTGDDGPDEQLALIHQPGLHSRAGQDPAACAPTELDPNPTLIVRCAQKLWSAVLPSSLGVRSKRQAKGEE